MYLNLILKVPKEEAQNIEEALYFIPKLSWETEEGTEEVLFKFYFPISLKSEDQERLTQLEKLTAANPKIRCEYALLKRENWETIWKYHFKPLKIGEKLLILPPWEEYQETSSEIVIYIDPGQAFGTGHHATTQLMLENLEKLLSEACSQEKKLKILDMGCGTGILAIASAKLCPNALIFAVDIDELALEATHKNIELNGVKDQIIVLKDLDPEREKDFDIILSNIGFRELKKLAPFFKKISLPQKTYLLLSGVLREDLPELEKIYQNQGFHRIKTQYLREWSFALFKLT